jgi:ComF family protein
MAAVKIFIQKHFLIPILDTLYPPLCYNCEKILTKGRQIICIDCWNKIPAFHAQLDRSIKDRSFRHIYILYEYGEIVQLLIHLLKYRRILSLSDKFALEAVNRFPCLKNQGYNAIIPVPLHRSRKRERGYNQSEIVAKSLGRILQIPVKSELLLRKRNTRSQTTMTKAERDLNVKNAFHCPHLIFEKTVLLIDDVITTGSTIESCIQCLKLAGVDNIDVLTVAHPPPPGGSE